jgi:hypothetical protein
MIQRKQRITACAALFLVQLIITFAPASCVRAAQDNEAKHTARPQGQITFTRDIAATIFEHCSGCHRPGQSAPFALLSYRDVQKHAEDIITVTHSRYMPPWPPENTGLFLGERRLNAEQLRIISQWVKDGMIEGAAADLPPRPQWASDWQLGPPDVVATMPRPYTLPAEGRDIYRNFVVPLPVNEKKYVRAIEFRPRSARIHHAFIRVDHTGNARRLEQKEPEPGFPGITLSAEAPGGNFLSWQPGRMAIPFPDGLCWEVNPGDDLIFQLHMNPGGKAEPVQSEIGLYFTNQPPTRTSVRVLLTSNSIDIPAGDQSYTVRDEYKLPADFDLIAILPHAHYLARRIEGLATFPDGRVQSLLLIKDWDFNWQSEYRYKTAIYLPKNTVLSMSFSFDNSTNNTRNPSNPPKPVSVGRQSTDEMAELWFQLVPRDKSQLGAFQRDYGVKVKSRTLEAALFALKKNPNDAGGLSSLGMIRYSEGKMTEAEQRFRAAVQSDPSHAEAHYGLGLIFRKNRRLIDARREFEASLQSDPWKAQTYGNLGVVCLSLGDFDCAEKQFLEALRLNPADALAGEGLRQARNARFQPVK